MALSRSVLRLSLILLLLHAPSGRAAVGPAVPSSCCLKTQDTKVTLERLVDYHIQNAVCPVKAVQIRTVIGRTICLDPSSPWAQRAMQYLDGKKMRKAATPLTSTAAMTYPAITAQLNKKATAASRIEDTTKQNEKATAASRIEDTTKQNKKATAASRIQETTQVLPVGKITVCVRDPDALQ